MTNSDDEIAVPEPKPKRSFLGWQLLAIFAVVGVVGLGTCGYTMNANDTGDTAMVGMVLIGISVAGIVLTGLGMAVAAFTGSKQ